MKITIDINTELSIGEIRVDDSDLAIMVEADDMYELMCHDIPLTVARIVRDGKAAA